MGLLDVHAGDRKTLKAQVLIQDTVWWKRIPFLVGQTLIVPAPLIRSAEKANLAIGSNQDEVFERVAVLLAALVEGLFVGITGSVDRALGPIVEKRDGASGVHCAAVSCGMSDSPAVRWGKCPLSAKA